jgi:Ca2+-binding EF-hand superfamily protein
MKLQFAIAFFFGAALAIPAFVNAQDEPTKRRARESAALFDRLDADKNGTLTKEEVPEERQRLFGRLISSADKDKDGKLTRDEFAAGLRDNASGSDRPGPGAAGGPDSPRGAQGDRPGAGMMAGMAILRAIDADGDGTVSAKEIENAVATLKKLDKNSDGQLTRDEIGPAGGPGGLAGGRGVGGLGGGTAMLERLREFDKNNDGKWSKDELPPRLQERFDALDANKDAVLDREELRQVGRGQRGGNHGGEPRSPGRASGRGRSDDPDSAKKKTE